MPRADPERFRAAASRFATGVTVITALDRDGEVCGMTVNSFVTVTLSPPTVLFLAKPGRTRAAITASGRYGVNVLADTAAALSSHFAGRGAARHDLRYEWTDALPRLPDCLAFFACSLVRQIELGDHLMLIAEVTACDHRDDAPLVFFGSRYHAGAGVPALDA
ncbi:Flavin reductase-like, FMN-binding [Rhodopseudomonas palustris HaA2]|uniref:Flavin reductase-like, FMN-binding n=1 Tax=Rhodopseudomonas palustris (strain HaA2) TaxID=316058 RepID=Q2IRH0_RHOP2|nr:flavin reductase family protein [Rhodopseudomonas palustris]ABD09190.1 Flavin reductase-like, FMN-binding [Rhodopseudomonas palustris HaA2]